MCRFACVLLALVVACSGATIPVEVEVEDTIPVQAVEDEGTSAVEVEGIEDRIVGGSNAALGLVPWQVSLRANNRHFCGGSIINQRWILTAAHCLTGNVATTTVVTNTVLLNSGGDHYRASRFILHPQYNSVSIRNDVGLVQVASNIVYRGNTVRAAILPTSAFTAVNFPGRVSGWGSTWVGSASPNHLQVLNVNIVSQAQCRTLGWRVTDENICTFNRAGQGTCHGDSGGPLTANNVLIGVVSFGNPCAVGSPDAYARVFTYLNWIRSFTG